MEKVLPDGSMFFANQEKVILAYSQDQLLGVYINENLVPAHDLRTVLSLLGVHGKSILVADYGSDDNILPKTAKALISKNYESLDF